MLNDRQKQAVEYNDGPLLIIAGAGTGKTTVVTEKIKHLILNEKVKPANILGLTFTEKAASEMEERVDAAVPYGFFGMTIGTFHAFADSVLRGEISHIGLNPGYKLMTQSESLIYFKKNLAKMELEYFRPLGNPNKFITSLLQHFSRLKDEYITPEEYFKWSENLSEDFGMSEKEEENNAISEKQKYLELSRAYRQYEKLKIADGKFDFSDLIYYLVGLLEKRPNILRYYRERYPYVLVDEFQDTNISQYRLIRLLCPEKNNPKLSVVGDDSQAIYKFRGASISNILNFMKDYPQAKQITLNSNYRSNQHILDASYKLIRNNDPDTLESRLGISKKLTGLTKGDGRSIQFRLYATGEEEAEDIGKEILRLKKDAKRSLSDFAVLVRTNNQTEPFVASFSYLGIPFRFPGPGLLLRQPEIKDLIAYLRLMDNIEDSVSLFRILSMEVFGIKERDLALLTGFCRKTNVSLYHALIILTNPQKFPTHSRYLPSVDDAVKKTTADILAMADRHLALSRKATPAELLYAFLEDSGWLKKMVASPGGYEEKAARNIASFLTRLKTLAGPNEDFPLPAVIDYLDISSEAGDSPFSQDDNNVSYDAVNILTVHSAKGLEFPVVFIASLAKGRFPSVDRSEALPLPDALVKEILPEGDYHTQEERRLFYVALTRAKERLYLSAAATYNSGKRKWQVSPFVPETVGAENVEKISRLKKEDAGQLSIFDLKPAAALSPTPAVSPNAVLKNFSYSQLENFRNCPLQYKFQYILKIPGPASAAASFGDTIHKTLQYFYGEYNENNGIGLERLLEIYGRVWQPVGFKSKHEEDMYRSEGIKQLTAFIKKLHPPKGKVVLLEKLFKIKINENTYITGKIDRVDAAGENFQIIDYKTGNKFDEKKLKKDSQLTIYALAAGEPSILNTPVEKLTLTYYFLKDCQETPAKKTAADIIKVKEEIAETANDIRRSSFPPKKSRLCDFCSYKTICPIM